jgi:adenine-specific DNA-methyltransferase
MPGKKKKASKRAKQVETLTHEEATRKNLATAELAAVAERMEELDPVAPVRFSRTTSLAKGEVRPRDPDLDPQIIWHGARIRLSPDQARRLQEAGEIEIGEAQLVWRGKDRQDWSDLVVQAPQLYIQEKVHPKAIIDDLIRRSKETAPEGNDAPDLFADFNGLDDPEARLEFYQHDQHWSNRMILGDSLLVMASLTEREHLRGQVQCIYIDPPYGIKFNSNWQVSTLSRDVKDGKREDVSREPEQVKAFRDTWKDGIHSYLTYLRDRLAVARELLTESGSVFVQIGDENVHRVRALMDEVFGEANFGSLIYFLKTTGKGSQLLDASGDYILWYVKNHDAAKSRPLFSVRAQSTLDEQYNMAAANNCDYRRLTQSEIRNASLIPANMKRFMPSSIYSDSGGNTTSFTIEYEGENYGPLKGYFWRTTEGGLRRLEKANRLCVVGNYLRYRMYDSDYPIVKVTNYWDDVSRRRFWSGKNLCGANQCRRCPAVHSSGD